MENDFLRELEYLGITARLKRLSDTLSTSIREIYKFQELDIEPSWHLVFLFLQQRRTCSMVEIAKALHLSQPALTKMIKRMVSNGYIEVIRDANDNRKKNLMLSAKAEAEFPKFEKVWDAGQNSVREILEETPEFIGSLEVFENQIRNKSFRDRALGFLDDD